MDQTAEKTLADNLRWLMEHHDTLTTQASVGKAAGCDQKTIGRVLGQTNSATLEVVAGIARAFKVEPWQMIAPCLGRGLYRIDSRLQVVPVRESGPPMGQVQPVQANNYTQEDFSAGHSGASVKLPSKGRNTK